MSDDFFDVASETVTLRDAVFTFALKPVANTPLPDIAWRVYRFEAREALSECWECVLDLVLDDPDTDPTLLVNLPATLVLGRPDLEGNFIERSFAGVIRSATRSAVPDHRPGEIPLRRARVVLVPELWLLSQETDCRIFQNLSVLEIVQAVLARAGLYKGRLDTSLHGTYPLRECCIQYNEPSLDFVQRLLEHEGIAYFFRATEDGERLVLTDHAEHYAPAATLNGEALRVVGDGMVTSSVESLRALDWTRNVPARRPVLRDYDFSYPDVPMSAPHDERALRAEEGVEFEYPAGLDQGLGALARARREQGVGRGARGQGTGNLVCLAAGTTFDADESGRAHGVAPPFVVTRIRHEGVAMDSLPLELYAAQGDAERYVNRFECMPLRELRPDGLVVPLPFRPPRVTRRPRVHGMHSATVVADPTAPGSDIALDALGRVRVRFHWDRQTHELEGSDRGASSCWIRTMQPWAGMGFGHVFVPRVGMEVVVSFLDGDPDRPVVLGSLYNGLNRPPSATGDGDLRRDATRSTIRTRSSPYGEGYNELSFEDAAGREEVLLKAERDLNEVVGRDHTVRVGSDESVRVGGNQSVGVDRNQGVAVGGDQRTQVDGSRRARVGGDETVSVGGNREESVAGDEWAEVRGQRTEVVGGRLDLRVDEDVTSRVGGAVHETVKGPTLEERRDDQTVRVKGCLVTLVGEEHAERSYAVHVNGWTELHTTRTMELLAEEEFSIRCGKSIITMTPTGIDVHSPSILLHTGESELGLKGERVRSISKGDTFLMGRRVLAKSAGAVIELAEDATIDGHRVRLKTPVEVDERSEETTVRPTVIELLDDEGHPIANQRYKLTLADGALRSGFLDKNGRASLRLSEPAAVDFPDLPEDSEEA